MGGSYSSLFAVAAVATHNLLRFQPKHDRLLLVRLHLASVLNSRRPLTTLLNNTHSLFPQSTILRPADRIHITHVTLFVHNELYDHRTLDLIVYSIVGITQVLIQITKPCRRTTGEIR